MEKEYIVTEKVLTLEKHVVKAKSKTEAKEKVKCQSNDAKLSDIIVLKNYCMKVENLND